MLIVRGVKVENWKKQSFDHWNLENVQKILEKELDRSQIHQDVARDLPDAATNSERDAFFSCLFRLHCSI